MIQPYTQPPSLSPTPISASFLPPTSAPRFEQPKPAPAVKRLDFPIRPHLLKFLQVHLKLSRVQEQPLQLTDYLLSSSGRFGLALTQLLRKPVKSARHEGSTDDCTAMLGVDLRSYKYAYYDLLQGKLSPYVVFLFNDFVEDIFRQELYWWVQQHYERRATIKDSIRAALAFYDITEEDVAYDTLRKDVQRNATLHRRKPKKKAGKTDNFPVNVSQKTGALSQKTGGLSQKKRVLSQRATFSAVRQELMKLPLPIFETDFFYAER
jgi:hypothetical protein